MEQELYGRDVAGILCQQTGWPEALDIRDDGVYVKEDYLAHDPGEQAFTWTPACDMDWHGAPDPLTAPALPIPFTSRNLAAFMLDAAGYGIQSKFGRIEHGLDEGELECLSMRATKVRKALREAYKLAQAAQCVVGADNIEEQQRAADLLSAYGNARDEALEREKVMERVIVGTRNDGAPDYGDFIPRDEYLRRLARVNEAVAALKAEAQEAIAESDAKHVEWRKAMVHQLLRPAAATKNPATNSTPADRARGCNEPEQMTFEMYQRLRRAVQLDQSRVTAEIEGCRNTSTNSITEIKMKNAMLAAGLAELTQINKRLDALDSEANFDEQHAAEISYAIEVMRTSRPDHKPFNAEELARRASEISGANDEIDALIAQRAVPPVVPADAYGGVDTAKAGPAAAVGASNAIEGAGPVAVNTRAMADSFAGLHWDSEQWIKKLGDKPVWLNACIVLHRGRGEGMRQWNPVLIGAYLVRMGHAKTNSVRAKFQTQDALKPWLDEWKTYEADNYPTD